MNVDDFAAVYKLGLRCYKVLDKPYNYWSIREVAAHLEGNPGLCFIAEENGKVIGFALGDEKYEVLQNTGHLEWIAVAPEYRREGVATRLIDTIVKVYRQLGKAQVVADISSENEASRGVARRSGFSEGISVTFFVKKLDPLSSD
jgi:ribosomal protein S18 acetylase RimI-like enzyme